VIGNIRRSNRAEENCVKGLQLLEPAFGYVVTVLLVIRAAPVEVFDFEPESALALRKNFERLQSGCDDFDADSVSRNCRNPVRAHGMSTNESADGSGRSGRAPFG
jgi:hypothetical protein